MLLTIRFGVQVSGLKYPSHGRPRRITIGVITDTMVHTRGKSINAQTTAHGADNPQITLNIHAGQLLRQWLSAFRLFPSYSSIVYQGNCVTPNHDRIQWSDIDPPSYSTIIDTCRFSRIEADMIVACEMSIISQTCAHLQLRLVSNKTNIIAYNSLHFTKKKEHLLLCG